MRHEVERYLPVVRIVLSLGLHLCALLTGLLEIEGLPLPATWTRDFLVVGGLSLVSSLWLSVVQRSISRIGLCAVRIVSYLIIGIPFGSIVTPELFLLTSVMIDVAFSFRAIWAAGISVFVVILTVSLQQAFSVYGLIVSRPSSVQLVVLGAWGVSIGVIAILSNLLGAQLRAKRRESEHQQSVIDELIGANRGYLEYASAVELESSEKERKRIISELHDVVGQAFTNILAVMGVSEKQPPQSDELPDLFSTIRSQASSGLDETRASLYKLHTFRGERPIGLKELHKLLSTFEQSTKVKIDLQWANHPWDLGGELNALVYRVLREALINSFRHGNATRISVQFWAEHGELEVNIADNGRGSKTVAKGIGLTAMQERVEMAGGKIHFNSSDSGFLVRLSLPIE